jgi:hypothetical protein
MDYERPLAAADRARSRGPPSRADRAFVRDEVPEELAAFPRIKASTKLAHPAGFHVSGAPVRTPARASLNRSASRSA